MSDDIDEVLAALDDLPDTWPLGNLNDPRTGQRVGPLTVAILRSALVQRHVDPADAITLLRNRGALRPTSSDEVSG